MIDNGDLEGGSRFFRWRFCGTLSVEESIWSEEAGGCKSAIKILFSSSISMSMFVSGHSVIVVLGSFSR